MVKQMFALGIALAVSASAHGFGGGVPRVAWYPQYYPPYMYSSGGPYYGHVYPYAATYHYTYYAPYTNYYPTAIVGGHYGPVPGGFAYPQQGAPHAGYGMGY